MSTILAECIAMKVDIRMAWKKVIQNFQGEGDSEVALKAFKGTIMFHFHLGWRLYVGHKFWLFLAFLFQRNNRVADGLAKPDHFIDQISLEYGHMKLYTSPCFMKINWFTSSSVLSKIFIYKFRKDKYFRLYGCRFPTSIS